MNRISDYEPFFSMHDGLYLWFWIFLQACADIKGSESSVESVECIAEWKEGSTYYFLGKKTIYNKTIKHFHTWAHDGDFILSLVQILHSNIWTPFNLVGYFSLEKFPCPSIKTTM